MGSEHCPYITIPDSDKSFEPVIGDSATPTTVTCNDGYIFNHDLLHNAGNIICKPDIEDNNTLKWFVHDEDLVNKCSAITEEADCKTFTHNPYEKLGLNEEQADDIFSTTMSVLDTVEQPSPCSWVTPSGGSPTCAFNREIDVDHYEKICQPVYCPAKKVPFSNRDGSANHLLLPGPDEALRKGECVNTNTRDKTGLEHIHSAEDCMCFKNTSCKTCTNDDNCKWCGSDDSGATDTDVEGNMTPGCYYKHSNHGACQIKSIDSDEPDCVDIKDRSMKQGWEALDHDNKSRTACTAEKVCIQEVINERSKSFLDTTTEFVYGIGDPELDITDSSKLSLFKIKKHLENEMDISDINNLPTEKICTSYNNTWHDTGIDWTGDNSICYYENNYVNTLNLGGSGITDKGVNVGVLTDSTDASASNISILPAYCEPGNEAQDNTCWGLHPTNCVKDNTCKLTTNLLNNETIKWATDNIFQLTGGCTIGGKTIENNTYFKTKNDIKPSTESIEFYDVADNNKDPLTIDTDSLSTCRLIYKNPNNQSNSNYRRVYPLTKYITGVNPHHEECVTGCELCIPNDQSTNCEYADDRTEDKIDGQYCHTGADNCDLSKGNFCKTGDTLQNLSDPTSVLPGISNIYTRYQDNMINEQLCNKTGFTLSDNKTIKSEYKASMCKKNDSTINSTQCNLINKRIDGNQTSYYGKYCSSENGIMSLRQVCNMGSAGTWEYGRDGWGCYNDNNELIPSLCNTINNDGTGTVSSDGTETVDSGGNWSLSDNEACLVEIVGNNDDNLQGICETWDVPGFTADVLFKSQRIEENSKECFDGANRCARGPGRGQTSIPLTTEEDCLRGNLQYVDRYEYSNINKCDLNSDQHAESQKLTWTGGTIKDENGLWEPECNATILSSCPVICQSEYGGGGDFVCNYNTNVSEVCEHVNNASPSEMESICNSYAACTYTEPTVNKPAKCEVREVGEGEEPIKGQPEWIGPECYRLNNDAFSKAIQDLPPLNNVFPPLARLIAFFVIMIGLSFGIYKTGWFDRLLEALDNKGYKYEFLVITGSICFYIFIV